MTMKKSNVKALALAVTCAILAGGGIGLKPVYAVQALYKDNYKGYITADDSGATGGADATKWKLTVINSGLKIGGIDLGLTNPNAITIGSNTITETDVANWNSVYSTVGNSSGGLVKDVADNKTNIETNKANIATKADQTALNTANGKITALEGKTIKFNNDGTTLTSMEEVGANKVSATKLAVGGKEITADTVAGYDAAVSKTANITYDATNNVTYINEGTAQQVVIDEKGLKVGQNSSRMNDDTGFATSKNLYVGTADAENPTAADSKFFVDGATGETVVKDTNGTTRITGGGVHISNATGSQDVYINEGTVHATTSVISPYFYVDSNNEFKNNSLKVGNGTNGVTIEDGAITTTGNATVGGTLGVTGNITGTDITATGVLKGGSLNVTGNATVDGTLGVTGNITGADITANGKLKGKTLGIGTNGTEFTVDADGAVKAAGGKVEIDKTGKATFGEDAGNRTTIEGKQINTGSIVATDTTVESTISGVKMLNGKITASSMEINGPIDLDNLKVKNQLTVDTLIVDKNGVVTGVQSINGVAVAKSGTGLTIGSATIGAANPFSSTGFTVDANGNVAAQNIAAGTYNGNTIGADNKFNGVELKGGDVKATKVTADTITDGQGFTANGGTVTANAITANTSATLAGVTFDTSGVDFNNKYIKNVANVTAKTADLGNLHIEGHVIKNNVDAGGPIGLGTTVTVNNAGALNNVTSIDSVSVGAVTGGNGLEFGGNAVIGATDKPFSSNGFKVDGAGNVTGKSFNVNGSNYLDSTGLTTEKAVIGVVNTLDNKGIDTSKNLHVGGQATFGNSTGIHTTINGGTITSTDGTDSTIIGPNKITTKTLEADTIILNDHMQDGAGNKIEIGADGHLNVAGNNFKIDTIGQLTNEYTGHDAAGGTTQTTLKTSVDGINANYTNSSVNHNNNLLNINKDGVALGVTDSSNNNLGMLSADANAATMGYGTANSIVVSADTIKSALGTDVTRVMTNSATEQSIVDAAGGMTITTNNTGTTFSDGTTNTLIKGSAITSTKATGDTGVLDGSNLTLTNGANSTALTAGGATFIGKKGDSSLQGNKTTIDGGVITTDTLNVERINLGGELYDKNGTAFGSNLSMDKDGNFSAAGGNFTVKGGTGTDRGALHNKVGNTYFDTTETSASMKFDTTTSTGGGIKSEVSVADGKAEMAVGTNAAVTATDGKVEIKGGTQTVTTTNAGTVFKNTAHKDPFEGGIVTETTINGNEITTGKITTDQLVIKGNSQSAAAGAGTGSIAFGGNGTIKSDINDGTNHTTFETNNTGTTTTVSDSTTTTENKVTAAGNSNTVTKDATHKSEFNQGFTSIGGVVTNGTVKMSQELTADGVKFEQTGYDEVNIAKGDVTVKNNRNTATPNQEVHLSDLGSLNNLDGELEARDEYQNNKTAVGAINAEAGIRREEVARLDNRIDDVNNRVDKVGAMAAAIASLKSIGYDPQAPSEFSIGLGQYKGETGVAMGFFHYPNKNFMINVSLSTAGGETMGGIGATWRFGHKSPQKLLEEQREAQAKKELAAAEKYQAAAKLAKEAQERAEYAAKLARQAQVSADNAKAAADATQAKHFG